MVIQDKKISATPPQKRGGFGEVLIDATGLDKRYGPVHAVNEISFSVRAGEALALCGENGAGKSTVFKILAGEVSADSGTILLKGNTYKPDSAAAAVRAGVSMVHQEFNILPNVSVAENIFVGRAEMFSRAGMINWPKLYAAAEQLLVQLGIKENPRAVMNNLSPSSQKMVELARALSTNPDVLLLDEITASLDHGDAEILRHLMDQLCAKGVGIVFVSHRIQEIFENCTTVEVMKDGAHVTVKPVDELDEDKLTALMVGRDIQSWKRSEETLLGNLVLELKGLSADVFKDVSLNVRQGEIVTLAGLAGSGADEILETIFGARNQTGGQILIDGNIYTGRSVPEAMSAKMAMVPKERAVEGLIETGGIQFNIGLASLKRNARGLFVNSRSEADAARRGIELFSIKTPSRSTLVRSLSGGNKQKVLLAKWFQTRPKLMMLNNPTRGVDVGVKFEIYELLKKLRHEQNLAVLLASEDMAEVIRLSDLVITIRHGRVSGTFTGDEVTETNLINSML